MERVYTRHIGDMGICLKYTRYMDCIYYAYAEKVEIYHTYTMIIHGIYFMVYPLYIPRLYIVYALYIYCIYLVYILYIFGIYNVYHRDIIIKKGTEQTHEVWSGYIPGILVTWAYA